MTKKVAVIMGSKSDLPAMKECIDVLKRFGVGYDVAIISAHRTPEQLVDYVRSNKSAEVYVAGAGGAAHLPGVIASHTTLPVIGVPMESQSLKGMDSLLSIAQMPGGVPVATMAIGQPGARNAGIFAVQILALKDKTLSRKLREFKQELAEAVKKNNLEIQGTV